MLKAPVPTRRWRPQHDPFVLAACLTVLVTGDLLPAHGADPADVVIRKIVLPVQRSFSYSDDFGDPRSGGRTHEGNDLMVPKLRPLLAAADARVRRITIDDGANEGNTPRGRAPTSTSRSTSPTAPR